MTLDLRSQFLTLDVHEPAVLGSSVVLDPPDSALPIHEDERVPRLAGGHPPPHHPVGVGHAVLGVGEDRRLNAEGVDLLGPSLKGIRGDAEQLCIQGPEPIALVQIHDLLDAWRSPGAHAEVEENGLTSPIVIESHGFISQ